MPAPGTVERIHVTPERGAPPESVDDVAAVADRGLRGDRYFLDDGTYADRDGCGLTLVEGEALDALARDYGIDLDPGAHRRNVTTRGVALNHLVGESFSAGGVRCRGVELCEPCAYLENSLGIDGVREALVHRGGLRARILSGGSIAVGDEVRRL